VPGSDELGDAVMVSADDGELIDPKSWFEALRAGADALDAWHRLLLDPDGRPRALRRRGEY